MGWFLSSNKKKGRKASSGRGKKKAAAKKKVSTWDPRRTLAVIRVVTWVVLLGGLAIGWGYGERWLEGRVAEHRAAAPRVELHDAPAWASGYVTEQLEAAVVEPLGANPFDRRSLRVAAEWLAASPWVSRVERIIRRPGGVVEVHAVYREPAALVEARDGYHLVDREAVRLPAVYAPESVSGLGLPVIRNVRRAPPEAGETWAGDDLRAGLRLARVVNAQPWRGQVEAIDVANYAGRADHGKPHLTLVTHDGLVRWGRAPGEEQFYEPRVAKKLEHLRLVLDRFETIDADGRVVDVFGDGVLVHPANAFGDAVEERPIGYTSDS